MGETTLENLNKQLKQTTWQRGELNVHAYASLNAARNDDLQRNITMLLFRFVGSLILLSGLINFLKFIIQMFYNRQRELALRKCLGSNIKGLFSLLFAEIFWMLSVAFLLSLIITEVVVSLAYVYIPQEDMISCLCQRYTACNWDCTWCCCWYVCPSYCTPFTGCDN